MKTENKQTKEENFIENRKIKKSLKKQEEHTLFSIKFSKKTTETKVTTEK
jgi:hypothetical protein